MQAMRRMQGLGAAPRSVSQRRSVNRPTITRIRSSSKPGGSPNGDQPQAALPSQDRPTPTPTASLDLAYESEGASALMQDVVKTTGLHRAPLSGGVKTATLRCGRGMHDVLMQIPPAGPTCDKTGTLRCGCMALA